TWLDCSAASEALASGRSGCSSAAPWKAARADSSWPLACSSWPYSTSATYSLSMATGSEGDACRYACARLIARGQSRPHTGSSWATNMLDGSGTEVGASVGATVGRGVGGSGVGGTGVGGTGVGGTAVGGTGVGTSVGATTGARVGGTGVG